MDWKWSCRTKGGRGREAGDGRCIGASRFWKIELRDGLRFNQDVSEEKAGREMEAWIFLWNEPSDPASPADCIWVEGVRFCRRVFVSGLWGVDVCRCLVEATAGENLDRDGDGRIKIAVAADFIGLFARLVLGHQLWGCFTAVAFGTVQPGLATVPKDGRFCWDGAS